MHKNIIFPVLISSVLVGCGGGILPSKRPPDETVVIEGPSLTLPPEYQLRPPREAAAAAERERKQEGRKILFGPGAVKQEAPKAPTENWLVEQAGGEARDTEIRQTLEKEFEKEKKDSEKGWITKQKEAILGGDE